MLKSNFKFVGRKCVLLLFKISRNLIQFKPFKASCEGIRDTAEKNEKFVVSSGIRTRISRFRETESISVFSTFLDTPCTWYYSKLTQIWSIACTCVPTNISDVIKVHVNTRLLDVLNERNFQD